MSDEDNSLKDKQQGGNGFVDKLIYENIDLMTENIKLRYENQNLSKRVAYLERCNRRKSTDMLVKEEEGYVVMIVKNRQDYIN